jgi:hypothetical protein
VSSAASSGAAGTRPKCRRVAARKVSIECSFIGVSRTWVGERLDRRSWQKPVPGEFATNIFGAAAVRADPSGPPAQLQKEPVTKSGQCNGPNSRKVIACLQPDRRVEIEVIGTKTVHPLWQRVNAHGICLRYGLRACGGFLASIIGNQAEGTGGNTDPPEPSAIDVRSMTRSILLRQPFDVRACSHCSTLARSA